MKHRTEVTAPDTEFFHHTGLGLVALTIVAGAISLFGSLALLPAPALDASTYGIDPVAELEITAQAD